MGDEQGVVCTIDSLIVSDNASHHEAHLAEFVVVLCEGRHGGCIPRMASLSHGTNSGSADAIGGSGKLEGSVYMMPVRSPTPRG